MKTIPFLALFATLILSSSYVSTVITQPATEQKADDHFKHFRIHRQGATVALSWAVASPDVSHFIIERSYDEGEYFDAINQMSCNGNAVHKYNDAFESGGVLTYRVVAVKSDGTQVYSAPESVRIVQRK